MVDNIKSIGKMQKTMVWGGPIDSPPMVGLDEFTIKKVGNPLIVGDEVNYALADILIKKTYRELSERVIRRKSGYSTMTYAQRLVASTDRYGRVKMNVMMMPIMERVSVTATMIVDEILGTCSENLTYAFTILDQFWTMVEIEEFKTPELMSTLLFIIENFEPEKTQEPKVYMNKPKPIKFVNNIVKIDTEKDLIKKRYIRLISVREMLRTYFERYPSAYLRAIAKVLNISLEEISSDVKLYRLIVEHIEKIGVRKFSEKVHDIIIKQIAKERVGDSIENGVCPPSEIGEDKFWGVSYNWRDKNRVEVIADMITEQLNEEGRS